ncbi:hypothetical protein HANVADRAFT_53286 [Hanseniaspora valbyensis NRRL Y-1626]|uniref:Uncharacterized protein n=1 Tax=Hanseniaspora valbyensis NRRL Y-1626 TaxID=766949 RepID=A0A1B7TBV0_9ASCO|nr:hypothetical protein HANVADRAFT_53286 [Hanseniaspora valbyensis NRRL Y-1626]
MSDISAYIKKIEQDVYNYNKINKITKDHYILLLDYILPNYLDVLEPNKNNDEDIDVRALLFNWYDKYDSNIESIIPQKLEFAIASFLPLHIGSYVYLRVLKFFNNNEDLLQIVEIICEKYEIDPTDSTYIEGLILPFIEYTNINSSSGTYQKDSLFWFSDKSNYSNVVNDILLLAVKHDHKSEGIFKNILVMYTNFYRNIDYDKQIINHFLIKNSKLIKFNFFSNLMKTKKYKEMVLNFIIKNMDNLHLTLADVNFLIGNGDDDLSFSNDLKLFNLDISISKFRKEYLPILNLLKTKDIVRAHNFLKKGSVQLKEFNNLIETRPEMFNNYQTSLIDVFNRIPKDYVLKKLINVTDNNDPSIFSKEMVINKFWVNFKQANTTSRTNRFLIICEDIALNNLSDVDNFINLINIVHLFPIHFKPSSILSSDNDSLISILIKEQKFNVIDTFNIIKKLNLVLERGDNDNDEYLLLRCQSEYINSSTDDNIEYLESTMNDFVDLLKEFKEYRCIFALDKSFDKLWQRLIEYVRNNAQNQELFDKLVTLVPVTPNNTKYLKQLLL